MSYMYSANSERNKVLYELWEKDLSVKEAAYRTSIARSTVGYYYRKFNRLAAKGRPIVFPVSNHDPRMPSSNLQDVPFNPDFEQRLLMKSMVRGNWEGLYYRLRVFKLLKELGLLSKRGQAVFLSSLEWWLDYDNTEADYKFLADLQDENSR